MAKETSEIRITNVPRRLYSDLSNIASNAGVNLSAFLKLKLRELADSFPQEVRSKKKD